ncbi:MAG: Sua5 family C-terminal domain-containing protein [Planctomycetaceae bacterium]
MVRVSDATIEVLRPGGVTAEEIADATGVQPVTTRRTVLDGIAQSSPGQLAQHYAPRTPVRLIDDWQSCEPDESFALLLLRSPPLRCGR